MTERGKKMADMMDRRNVNVLCLQEKQCERGSNGRYAAGIRNKEESMVVDFAKKIDLAVVNIYFNKKDEHRVTYKSSRKSTQVDYMMCKRGT